MKIAARVFPGTLVSQNKGALIWGDHGLIAYAANTTVAVVDSTTMQHVTALHSHRSPITKICWAPSSIPVGDVDDLFLASADTSGFIIIFNVTAGKAKQKLSESNKVVNALELFHTKNSELYLLSLHQPALLILWNPKSGEQIWKKSFSESLSSFSRDPFSEDCIVLNGGGFVQFVKDFSCSQAPSDGTRFFLSSNSSAEPPLSSPSSSSEKNRVTSMFFDFPRRSRLMLSDRSSSKAQISVEDDNQLQLSNLLSVKYHCTRRNTLVLVYTQDILILDLDIKQTISVVSLERSTCPFVEVYPCRYRDAMYCLHDNGTVVFRIRKLINGTAEAGGSEGSVAGKSSEFGYESHCSSDGMRITKSQKVYGLAVCPVTEMKAAVVTSEGKLLVWELSPVSRHINAGVNAVPQYIASISELLNPSTSGQSMLPEEEKLSFFLTGVSNSLSQGPFVIRMCPPLTTKNFHIYQPYLAVGSVKGTIQIFDIQTGHMVRDESVLSCQVRGIEWASLHSLVAHGCENLNGNTGKSEIAFVNIKTGNVTNFRPSKPDEGVVQMIRISHMKHYMVIVFKNKPMELWEMKTLTLLREMPSNFPTVTSLEWSPSSFKKKLTTDDNEGYSSSHSMVKEHFVFTDNTCLLHHYTVEGSLIKDGSTIGAQGVSGTVTAMGWKNELLCLGDVNSNITFWNLRYKKTSNWAMGKGMVRKIRFAPGKENSKILMLFNEEVQVYDRVTYMTISSLSFPKAIGRVSDADWAASDKIALSIADGYVAITDVSMQHFMTYLHALPELSESYLPCVYPASQQLLINYQLYPQPWSVDSPEQSQLVNFPDNIKKSLQLSASNNTQHCLLASHLCGNRFAIDFWTIASHYMKVLKNRQSGNAGKNADDSKGNLFVPSTAEEELTKDSDSTSAHEAFASLESSLEIFSTNKTFKENELSRVTLQELKNYGGEARLDCARRYILLGEYDRAVHLLLQSESDSSSSYTDSLRACLLATVRTSGASQSTLKLVATSLIAHGKLAEGVELLCLIDKSLDACRYLQSYGHWDEAVWLSKVTLPDVDSAEVISRWINDYLTSPSVNQKKQAVLAALSTGDLMKVVELLYGMQCFSLAANFIEACFQEGLLAVTKKNSPTIEAVYLQYGRLLNDADMDNGAIYCWGKAGEQGKQCLVEMQLSSSSN